MIFSGSSTAMQIFVLIGSLEDIFPNRWTVTVTARRDACALDESYSESSHLTFGVRYEDSNPGTG